tara:strand:+ start:3560 stop:4978 length:1419 start_codon:yes stop_codon:yes gene_type:complete
MIFSSAQFVFLFLPISLLGLWILRSLSLQRYLLPYFILLSIIFYIDWNYTDIAFVAASILTNYIIACKTRFSRTLKIVLGVTVNAGYLLLLKLLVSQGAGGGTVEDVNLFGALGLPLGISFITFQQIAFVVDEAEKRDSESSFQRYLFFVMFFPQLISGPIVKHHFIIPQTFRKPFRYFSHKYFLIGITYLCLGIGKKVLIADPLDEFNTVFYQNVQEISFIGAWVNMFLYSFKIYFDFSAYADMAVGLGYMFGIHLPRNFFSPHKATNIANFWRIWHISLHHFFKEYVYARLVRISTDIRWIIASIIVVMILSSVWHGVGLGYLVWGSGHALGVIGYRLLRHKINFAWSEAYPDSVKFIWRWFCRGFVFLYVSFLWVPFATNDVSISLDYWKLLFNVNTSLSNLPFTDLTHLVYLALAFLIVFTLPNTHQITLGNRKRVWPLIIGMVVFAASVPYIVSRAGQTIPFVYFQF